MTPEPPLTTDPTATPTASAIDADPSDVNNSEATQPQRFAAWREPVSIPRWIIYSQAALLGGVGTLFFLFGILVGHFTSDRGTEVNATFDCRVIGTVAYRIDGDLRADEGAVVFLLPELKKPDQRSPAELVNPATFKALDNAAIDRIHELGGAVVRTDENGSFDVMVDANYGNGISYYLLVVSKNKRGFDTSQLTKEQNAVISTFFIPVEDVLDDRSYHWMKVVAYEERLDLPEIEF